MKRPWQSPPSTPVARKDSGTGDGVFVSPGSFVVTPVGGQGFIFGRGNQQLSAAVLEKIDLERVVVVATEAKIGRSMKKRENCITHLPPFDF